MTTDLRAALRAAAHTLSDPVLRRDENAVATVAAHCRALADAAPTVAELLPIFVVIKTTGEYSDRSHDIMCWFPTEAEAAAHVAKLTAEYKPNLYDYDEPRFCYWQIKRGPVAK